MATLVGIGAKPNNNKKDVEKLTSQIATLTKELEASNNKNVELEGVIENLNKEIDELKASNEDLTSQIATLTKKPKKEE